jgi:sulfotransferase
MKDFHFISGLPRSGSTLLAGILRQNPDFSAGMSSPVYRAFSNLQKDFSADNEFSFETSDTQRINILRGLFASYYSTHPQKIIFDTNRGWTSKLPSIAQIFPSAKLICLVRPIVEIIESVERIVRSNNLSPSRIFNFEPNTNVYSRVDSMLLPSGLIGSALNNLKDGFYGPEGGRILLLSYHRLISEPSLVLENIYDFLSVPKFIHDFNSIEYSSVRYDEHVGLPGLHTVKNKITHSEHESVLPTDIAARFRGTAFWASSSEPSKARKLI